MESTVISFVTATPSPWSKRTKTFTPSWVAIRAFLAVYLFISTHTIRTFISRKSWADFGILRVITRGCMSVGSQEGFQGYLLLVYRCHSEMEQVMKQVMEHVMEQVMKQVMEHVMEQLMLQECLVVL